VPIFIFQFKVTPESGYHLTVKHGYAGVYVRADELEESKRKAREYTATYHWIISEVVIDGFEYNPELHGLQHEAVELYRLAKQNGASIGIAAVGFAPDGSGIKS
jgi:hypothetical protein